ncbi:ATP/GTP-binding protein [Streptomyces abyssalis]|uniref:ATP/GTP-binding protein n=1 Tax=Streptomyces abyssalis TaxID=933944 RepID=A0A1E7JU28_9ACTN|nr:NUDIX hydrolase [Streptomyces abyssalis]OEU88875.1 ATP/GTP-binding protein [Streptomyces abyssalis]OEU93467.1 ATP/GTP-binding protein [Streptomyces abyssalis]OEV30014.1 ATP/GTP-binding protein [Streptomyces nanshensis]
MIVWLNGAFGAGKTTAAHELLDLIPGSTLCDPALIGTALRDMLPKERLSQVDHYQQLPSWRRLVADTAAALLTEVPGPLIVPMTLLRQEYRDEIFGALAARRIPVRHVLLHADETILRTRIDQTDDTAGRPDRSWCRGQLTAYRAALGWLTADAHTVETSRLTPRQTAEEVAGALREGAGTLEIVQTPEPKAETVAAGVLLFDEHDRVLLVDPTYKPGWEFPGGVVEPGEAPARAGLREVAEELGLRLKSAPRLLVTDWEPPRPPGYGGIRLLFDGGRLAAEEADRMLLPGAELRGWRFVTEAEAAELLPPVRLERLRGALRARKTGRSLYLEAGVPVGEQNGRDAA